MNWRKSRRSPDNNYCIEAATSPGTVAVRDSKHPSGEQLQVSPRRWRVFVAAVRSRSV